MKAIRLLLAFLTAAMVIDAGMARAADIAQGQRLARRWCATCHVVAANQRQSTSEATPFAVIARRPNFNPDQLAVFLLNPHPRMPSMSLTRPEVTDIAAYIGSLAK